MPGTKGYRGSKDKQLFAAGGKEEFSEEGGN